MSDAMAAEMSHSIAEPQETPPDVQTSNAKTLGCPEECGAGCMVAQHWVGLTAQGVQLSPCPQTPTT